MNALSALDWAVLTAYLAVVGVIGVAASRRVHTSSEMSLAGRSMPTWAVSVSILATALSAVTFVGAPEDAYTGDLTYLSLSLGSILGAVIVAFFFLPRYYRAGVTTVYEMIGSDDAPAARRAAAAVFLAGRLLASGARLYVAAIPASLILFGDLALTSLIPSIALLAAIALVYTTLGGIRAVIWTDTLQAAVFLFAAIVSIAILADRIDLSPGEITRVLNESGDKLRLFDLSTDLERPYTLWSALIGFSLLNIAAFGADQDLTQRMLTCRSSARATASLLASSLLGVVMTVVFLIIGLLLFVAHERDAVAAHHGDDSRRVFVDFILTETPAGVRGLMLAGLFAAAMSSLDSALNAMSTSFSNDFRRTDATTPISLARTRALNLAFGLALALVATLCATWQKGSEQGLIPFALGVMVFAYAGLLGVFTAALFFRRGSATSLIAALITGPLVVAALQWLPEWWPLASSENTTRPSLGWRMALGTLASLTVALLGRPITEPERDA